MTDEWIDGYGYPPPHLRKRANEPTVQVPVSLLRRWEDHYSHRIPPAFYDELLALLSQPTPSAEPRLGVSTCYNLTPHRAHRWERGIGDEPDITWVPLRCGGVPAAPPRIEDMAPGTTEDAIRADEREQWASYFEDADASVGHRPLTYSMAVRLLRGQKPFGVAQGDPSTIRDVTPPS